uniref:hypothetical protein n=1 Tax=Roseivirga sp. TaxID=1964215 RepID=UPI0040474441
MLKALSKLNDKLMKSDEFNTQTERIRNYYFLGGQGYELSPDEDEVRKKAEHIFDMFPNQSKNEIRDFLIDKYKVSRSHAYYLIRQASEIFGVANQVDKEGLRAIQTARYEAMLKTATDELTKTRILERIDKINHLEDRSTPSINIEKLLMIPSVEVTTDPQVLDIQYEDDAE